MRRLALFSILSLSTIFPYEGLAYQTPIYFDEFTTANGLSHNIVNSIAQDREGFLWFGTEDGLNRFDGYEFRVYKNIPGDSSSLLSSWIRCLFVARDGGLWVGSSGLQRYDPSTDSFRQYSLDSTGNPRSRQPEVFAIAEDSAGTLWVGTTSGLWKIHPGPSRHRSPLPSPHASHIRLDFVSSLCVDHNNILWAGTARGLEQFDPGTGHFLPVKAIRSFRVDHIVEAHTGTLWLSSTVDGVLRFNPATGAVRRYSRNGPRNSRLASNIAFGMAEDRTGTVWVGLVGGLDLIGPSGDVVRSIKNTPAERRGLTGSHVYAILCDRAGTVWLGTAHGGINRFDARRNRFGLYRGGPAWQVFSVLEDRNGNVWLGSTKGLEWFDPVRGVAKPGAAKFPGLNPLPRDVLALFQDREGYLWVGYREKRNLERINLRTGDVQRYPFPEVRAIFQDRDGEIWLGSWFHGVTRLNPATGQYRVYQDDPALPGGPQGGGAWVFYEDSNGRIWMGTWGGLGKLSIFEKTTGRFSQLPLDKDAIDRRAGVYVRAILADATGTLWFGTWGNGLQRFDPRTNTVTYFYEQQGLPSNFVKGLLRDESGELWVSTERGLSRFNPRTGQFRNFTTDDGLQGDMFLSGSACRGRRGMMYFGGDKGLNFFLPDSIQDNPVPPPVVITGFRIFDHQQQPSTWKNRTIALNYEQDFISFDFVGLDYTNSARNQYAYMLEGFDRDWVQAGTRRYAAYTHLDGGTYTFRVKASNSDGVWNTEGASLTITISPPFWNTWWFRISAIVITAVTISVGFRVRLRHQLALERLRQRIAGDLHDDVGTELSSIVLGSQYLARTLPLKESDRTQVEKLGVIARNTHEMMRDIVWMLRSDNDTLDELIVKMREVAAHLLGEIRYTFNAPSPGESKQLQLETKRNFFLFYKEVLNNIVRHSGATTVTISMASSDGSMELMVIDNGRGFDQNHGSGAGLGNLRTRAEAMKADLLIEPNPGNGTIIRLRCPTT